jgi:ribosome biogenesis GTPase
MQRSDALIIAAYSRRMRIRLADGAIVEARIKGKTLKPVCGDRVTAESIENENDWLITDIHSRTNELGRPNMRGKTEILAANIELLIVVAAATPKPDWFIVDRYLCAAENMGADALVVFNKSDIAEADDDFRDYERIGYTTLSCSAETGENIALIGEMTGQRTAIIVGQSGVGKSSIINALCGDSGQRTAAVSGKTKEGRHTTVNSEMLDIPGGARIIDSPGVRDYAPALTERSQVLQGFREIEAAGQQCRFANCRHLREPHCTVKANVETGAISARRYESYRRLLALMDRIDVRS